MAGPTPEEKERVKELHLQGLSQRQIAKEVGWSLATVHKIIKNSGLTTDDHQTRAATAYKGKYNLERRLKLNDLWFEKIERVLSTLDPSLEEDLKILRILATPYGIAEDKRRMIEAGSAATGTGTVTGTFSGRFDLSKLTDEELEDYGRIAAKLRDLQLPGISEGKS